MPFDVGGVVLTSPSGTTLDMSSGATSWMAVNASGILTRPQTPFFRGQLTGKGGNYSPAGGHLLVTADVNFGGCWNDTTGYFICPVAGYYIVTGGNIANTQAGYFYIQKNGVTMHYTHWNHVASWHYVSLSDIVSCAVGDTLRYLIGGLTPGTNGFYGAGGHCMYSIALMA